MRKHGVGRAAKILLFLVLFIAIFCVVQAVFSHINNNFKSIAGFYRLEDQSVDVLFLGPSQMFCSIDAPRLAEKYDMSSYDFGAGGQPLFTTYYYLQEALKHQSPKVVVVEISKAFAETFADGTISLNYSLMPLTAEKYDSLKTLFDNDSWKAAWYCIPLISSHSMWNQLNPISLMKELFNYKKWVELRGFWANDAVEEVNIAYLMGDEGTFESIDEKAADGMLRIAELCEQNNIQLVFFKAPVADWTRSDSKAVKKFMEENDLIYLEMNDYLEEIGIDPDTDFANASHLNKSGADKTTDYIAEYLIETFDLS